MEYLYDPRNLRLIPGAAKAIRLLNEAQIPVLLVTNQAGIGRGYYTEQSLLHLHRCLERRLAAGGAHLDGIYHCPHHPDQGCECRKPQPGMLLRAAQEHGLDLARSFMVGDKIIDLQAGRRSGCRTVLVLTGYGRQMRQEFVNLNWQPDLVARNLLGAVKWILTTIKQME
jgi:D-glycero-D-manno-heptose 1,7-bisphosphate phosphatase